MVDDFSKHELLDRTSVVMELFGGKVLKHPAVDVLDVKEDVEEIFDRLYKLYQKLGSLTL